MKLLQGVSGKRISVRKSTDYLTLRKAECPPRFTHRTVLLQFAVLLIAVPCSYVCAAVYMTFLGVIRKDCNRSLIPGTRGSSFTRPVEGVGLGQALIRAAGLRAFNRFRKPIDPCPDIPQLYCGPSRNYVAEPTGKTRSGPQRSPEKTPPPARDPTRNFSNHDRFGPAIDQLPLPDPPFPGR